MLHILSLEGGLVRDSTAFSPLSTDSITKYYLIDKEIKILLMWRFIDRGSIRSSDSQYENKLYLDTSPFPSKILSLQGTKQSKLLPMNTNFFIRPPYHANRHFRLLHKRGSQWHIWCHSKRNIAVGNAACPVPNTVLGWVRAEGVKPLPYWDTVIARNEAI